MLRLVTPHVQVTRVTDIDVPFLRERSLEGVLLDLDNTLREHRGPTTSSEVRTWLREIQSAGIRCCLFSNAREHRLKVAAADLGLPYVASACKPLPIRCLLGLETLGTSRERTAIIGDQIFADILAGRLAHLYTILVEPVSDHEPWFTRLKRPVERRVLRVLRSTGGTNLRSPNATAHGDLP